MLRLALDQNFPTPLLESLSGYLTEVELVSVRDVDSRLTVLDDWQVLLALRQLGGWSGLVTTDVKMLRLPKEMVVLEQTKLGLIVTDVGNHDPLRAAGLLLAHLPRVSRQSVPGRAQVWHLRVGHGPPDEPRDLLEKIAKNRGGSSETYLREHRLSSAELRDPVLI